MHYIPLHINTCYTFLNSSLKIDELISICKKNSFSSIGICDLNNVYAFPKFNKACLDNNIKPLFGTTLEIKGNTSNFSLCVYVRNEEGYSNLCTLISHGESLNSDFISSHSKGLILVLPCFSNKVIYNAFKNGTGENLHHFIYTLQKNFDCFYLGIELYEKENKEVMKRIREYADKYTFKTIAFPKHLYETKHDALTLKLLNAIKNDERIEVKGEEDGPYYFLSEHAVSSLYTKEELEETYRLSNSIDFTFEIKRGKLLRYNTGTQIDKKKFILFKCNESMSLRGINLSPQYKERLNYELDIIEKMGYLDYFLIVADYVNEAKDRGILVGPGRGSAVGALVSYCLGITDIDPMKYDLLFERFLNPERVSMPDIDVDFEDSRRNEVVSYIGKKYGNSRMSYITTFQTIQAKQSIRDIGRIISFNEKDISTLSRACRDSKLSLEENRKKYPEFASLVKDNYFGKVFELAKKIEGYPRQSGIHPAGIILNDEPLENIIPLKIENGVSICEYEAPYLEIQGFLKMDILALQNLTIINNTLSRIKSLGKPFSLKNIPLNDTKTFLSLNAGLTLGIFQLEDRGITSALKQIKVNSFDDIVAVIALYRPGPMAFIKTYADNKNGVTKINYIDPSIEDILKPTYGVIVYQEQIMQISQKIASFSLGEADLLRRAISKKDENKMVALKEKFIKGALKNNHSLETSNKIYEMIERFADYGFNKSHAVAYALIAYQMAYLKANFSSYFFASLLDAKSISDKYAKYIKEFSISDIGLGLPSINISEAENYKVKENKIIIPFYGIKGLPNEIGKAIVHERNENGPFKDFIQFTKRLISYNINEKQIISLIDAGAFDSFNVTRASLREFTPTVIAYAKSTDFNTEGLTEEEIKLMQPRLNEIPENEETKLLREMDVLGVLISGSLFSSYSNAIKANKIRPIEEVISSKEMLTLALIIGEIRVINTKKNKTMAILTCYDDSTSINVTIFSDEYEKYKINIEKNKPLKFNGYFRKDDYYGDTFIANAIEPLEVNK